MNENAAPSFITVPAGGMSLLAEISRRRYRANRPWCRVPFCLYTSQGCTPQINFPDFQGRTRGAAKRKYARQRTACASLFRKESGLNDARTSFKKMCADHLIPGTRSLYKQSRGADVPFQKSKFASDQSEASAAIGRSFEC